MTPAQRRRAVESHLRAHQDGVASRRELLAADLPRWFIRNEIRQRRWRKLGRQAVVLYNGPATVEQQRRAAVINVGSRAALDGVTALQAAGLRSLKDTEIHVATPRGSTPAKPKGVVVHETRRFREEDVLTAGVRRVAPAVAAVHAALWARSDRQAKLFLIMVVQQRLASVAQLDEAVAQVKRHRRRRALRAVVAEVAAGVMSINELDVAEAMRRRGLPEPTRQAVRKRRSGTQYLDAEFDGYDVVLEIDGAGHDEASQRLDDLLRDLTLITEGRTVIRISVIAWALDQKAVLDGLEKVFRTRGWGAKAA